MGLLTFSLNVTLDGCVDHREGSADDETHAFFTRLMDEGGAMLWGRVTYEMMESYWPAVARGDEEAPPAIREWAVKLEAKPKYVVSSTRTDFPWTNSHHLAGDLRTSVQQLKDATPAGVLLGSGTLATELDRLDLIDEYQFLLQPRIAGHGPPCTRAGCPARDGSSCTRRHRSATARSVCTTGARAADDRLPRTVRCGRRRVPVRNLRSLSTRPSTFGSRDKLRRHIVARVAPSAGQPHRPSSSPHARACDILAAALAPIRL